MNMRIYFLSNCLKLNRLYKRNPFVNVLIHKIRCWRYFHYCNKIHNVWETPNIIANYSQGHFILTKKKKKNNFLIWIISEPWVSHQSKILTASYFISIGPKLSVTQNHSEFWRKIHMSKPYVNPIQLDSLQHE